MRCSRGPCSAPRPPGHSRTGPRGGEYLRTPGSKPLQPPRARRGRRHFAGSENDRSIAPDTSCAHPVLQYYGMVQVVAAILERDGLILIGQRTPEQSHPLKWEFPGGKVVSGETPEQALARELEEELGI